MSVSPRILDAFFAQTTDNLFLADSDGRLLRVSDALTRNLAPPSGASLLDLAHPEDRAAALAAWSGLGSKGASVAFPCRLRGPSGGYRSFVVDARRPEDSEGEVCGVLRPQADDEEEVPYASRILRLIFENLPVVVWAATQDGTMVLQEGKALADAGLRPKQWIGMNLNDLYGADPASMVSFRQAFAGKLAHFYNESCGRSFDNYILPVRTAQGDVDLALAVSLDITESKRTERELEAKLKAIEDQKQVIRSLATPIIQVWDGVLTMPLVGVVDSMRAAEVMDGLLNEVVRTRARFAVLDVTGVEVMDTATAGHLIRLVRSLSLLGAVGIITGIRPVIAQTMVGIGVEMESITTLRDLRQGLQYCIERLSQEGGPAPRAR